MDSFKKRRTEVKEADIGLIVTMAEVKSPTPLPRGRGQIKSLYSDFIVRELHYKTGEPVVLKDLTSLPPVAASTKKDLDSSINLDSVRAAFAS